MRARDAIAGFCLTLTFLWAHGTHAQSIDEVHVIPHAQPAEASQQPSEPSTRRFSPPLRIDVDLVLVPATVTDKMNRPVIDLQKENFGLYENEAQQQIRYFTEEDQPISIGLILDVSKSMSDKIDTERAAVAEFFKNSNPQDDYFVISLGDRPHLIADTTQSLEDIQQKLALVIPDGHTALLDAIYMGVAKMRAARYQRCALLIISDGGDNHSHYTARETRSMVQESDVLVYSIGIFDDLPFPGFKTLEEKLGQRLLVDITEASGGRTIAADHREKVPEIAATISRELRQQYVLGYKSNNVLRDGKWRKIKVEVTAANGDPSLRAYYKKGYLAPEK
jgi:Ca-activated chloride channel homolog